MIAEAAVQLRRPDAANAKQFRLLAGFVSMLSNNLPDFDALYTRITTQPLGSLLHHRGHTHTLLVALPLGLLALPPALWWAKRGGSPLSRRDLGWLASLALLGGWVHIAFDLSNSYGVHPLWPFFSGWFYGDSVFIIEPFLWAAMVPPLYFAMQTPVARILLLLILLSGIVLCFIREFVPRSMALAVTFVAVVLAVAAHRANPRARAALAVAATMVVILTFVTTGRYVRGAMMALAARDFPAATTHDLVLTPMPANPLCWSAVLLQTEGDTYYVRSGLFATLPEFMDAKQCPLGPVLSPTAPSRYVGVAARPQFRFLRQFVAPRSELRRLHDKSCVVAAFLRFARAPYWTAELFGARTVGDVRYDRVADLDFADVRVERSMPCPRFVPSWTPPRQDLLE